MKKNKKKKSWIEGTKYFLAAGRYKAENEVVYRRMSDDKVSLGQIKWFEESKDKILVTLTDSLVGSFQTCYLEDIVDSPDKNQLKKLKTKREKLA